MSGAGSGGGEPDEAGGVDSMGVLGFLDGESSVFWDVGKGVGGVGDCIGARDGVGVGDCAGELGGGGVGDCVGELGDGGVGGCVGAMGGDSCDNMSSPRSRSVSLPRGLGEGCNTMGEG